MGANQSGTDDCDADILNSSTAIRTRNRDAHSTDHLQAYHHLAVLIANLLQSESLWLVFVGTYSCLRSQDQVGEGHKASQDAKPRPADGEE